MAKALISDEIINLMERELPSYFPRKEIDKLTHGLMKAVTLSNLEAAKIGPPVHYMGRKACYVRTEFIEWLKQYYGGMYDTTENLTGPHSRVC